MSHRKIVIYPVLVIVIFIGIKLYFDYNKYNISTSIVDSRRILSEQHLPNNIFECKDRGGLYWNTEGSYGCLGTFPIFSSYDNVRCWWFGGKKEIGGIGKTLLTYCRIKFGNGAALDLD